MKWYLKLMSDLLKEGWDVKFVSLGNNCYTLETKGVRK